MPQRFYFNPYTGSKVIVEERNFASTSVPEPLAASVEVRVAVALEVSQDALVSTKDKSIQTEETMESLDRKLITAQNILLNNIKEEMYVFAQESILRDNIIRNYFDDFIKIFLLSQYNLKDLLLLLESRSLQNLYAKKIEIVTEDEKIQRKIISNSYNDFYSINSKSFFRLIRMHDFYLKKSQDEFNDKAKLIDDEFNQMHSAIENQQIVAFSNMLRYEIYGRNLIFLKEFKVLLDCYIKHEIENFNEQNQLIVISAKIFNRNISMILNLLNRTNDKIQQLLFEFITLGNILTTEGALFEDSRFDKEKIILCINFFTSHLLFSINSSSTSMNKNSKFFTAYAFVNVIYGIVVDLSSLQIAESPIDLKQIKDILQKELVYLRDLFINKNVLGKISCSDYKIVENEIVETSKRLFMKICLLRNVFVFVPNIGNKFLWEKYIYFLSDSMIGIFAANPSMKKEVILGFLFDASYYGIETLLAHLISFNVDFNVVNSDGLSPLFLACQKGHLNVVNLLLEHGAKNNFLKKINATPFIAACKANKLDILARFHELNISISNSIEILKFSMKNNELSCKVKEFLVTKYPDFFGDVKKTRLTK